MSGQRGIFLSAALFNWGVAGALMFALPSVEHLLGLEPVAPAAQVFVDLFAVLVIAFGCGYWMAAQDLRRYRLFAVWGAWAKLAVVLVVLGHFLAGHIGWRLVALSAGDLIYATVFWALLRNAGQAVAQGTAQ
ncbi:hypothetical protein ACLUTX_29505 [Enterobacterales bacterium AE_CKDN230030158-1A_HGKHYDSX7]